MSALRPSSQQGSYRRHRYGHPRDDWFARFLRREIRGLFRSRRNRRMWGAIALGVVLVVVYATNGF